MRIGFHSNQYSPKWGVPVPLLAILDSAHDAGFACIGLDLGNIDASTSPQRSLRELQEELRVRGLECSDLVGITLDSRSQELDAATQRLAHVGEVLGCPLALATVPTQVDWDELVETTSRCAGILAEHGMRLGIEFVPYYALSTLEDAMRLCRAVPDTGAAVVLDALHFFRSGATLDSLDQLTPQDLALVQLSDAVASPCWDLQEESRHHRLLPGDGSLPLATLVQRLNHVGYDGDFVSEVLSRDLRTADPGEYAARVHAAMNRCCATAQRDQRTP
jgi:sugar phosphate isomerase/epimerase